MLWIGVCRSTIEQAVDGEKGFRIGSKQDGCRQMNEPEGSLANRVDPVLNRSGVTERGREEGRVAMKGPPQTAGGR